MRGEGVEKVVLNPLGIFLLHQLLETAPDETIEAALIDGAGAWALRTE